MKRVLPAAVGRADVATDVCIAHLIERSDQVGDREMSWETMLEGIPHDHGRELGRVRPDVFGEPAGRIFVTDGGDGTTREGLPDPFARDYLRRVGDEIDTSV